MKRKIVNLVSTVAATVAMFFTVNANAQSTPAGDSKDTRLGIGLSLGIPTDDAFSFAIGGDLRLQKDFVSNVSGTLGVGYTNFSVKGDNMGSIGYIPVKAGIKVFPVERFYISGELGAAFGTDKGQGTAFVYAPGVGVGFNNGLDLGLRYEGFSQNGGNLGQVALRIAYGFNLSR